MVGVGVSLLRERAVVGEARRVTRRTAVRDQTPTTIVANPFLLQINVDTF